MFLMMPYGQVETLNKIMHTIFVTRLLPTMSYNTSYMLLFAIRKNKMFSDFA